MAGLEARAAAEDPALAAQLGSRARRLRIPVVAWIRRGWDACADQLWPGPLLSVGGLLVMLWSLDASAVLSVAGACLTCAGLLWSAQTLGPRLRHRFGGTPGSGTAGS
ncbi:MAG: hypothetical protein ACYC1D_04205 [Acidimicrobiales bacterium]